MRTIRMTRGSAACGRGLSSSDLVCGLDECLHRNAFKCRTPYALLGAAVSAAVPAFAGHRILASAAQNLALALVGGFNLPGKLFRQSVGGDGGKDVVR